MVCKNYKCSTKKPYLRFNRQFQGYVKKGPQQKQSFQKSSRGCSKNGNAIQRVECIRGKNVTLVRSHCLLPSYLDPHKGKVKNAVVKMIRQTEDDPPNSSLNNTLPILRYVSLRAPKLCRRKQRMYFIVWYLKHYLLDIK